MFASLTWARRRALLGMFRFPQHFKQHILRTVLQLDGWGGGGGKGVADATSGDGGGSGRTGASH